MPIMISFKRSDVVLVSFVFSDETGIKQRPTVVLSTESYDRSRQEIIVAAVTSNVDRLLVGDYRIAAWRHWVDDAGAADVPAGTASPAGP